MPYNSLHFHDYFLFLLDWERRSLKGKRRKFNWIAFVIVGYHFQESIVLIIAFLPTPITGIVFKLKVEWMKGR